MQEPERLLASGATDFERKLLEAVKDERPSAELQQRMQQALGLPSGTLPPTAAPPPAPTAAPPPAPVGAVLGDGLSGVVLKVILGSVVAGGLAYSIVALTTIEGDQNVRAPAAPPERAIEAAPQRAVVAAPAAAESSGAEPETTPRPNPAQARADETPDEVRRAPTDSDNLRVEIELLDAVRAASSLGEGERAQEALERYDARFPRGALQREAEMLRRGGLEATGGTPSAPSRGVDPEAASGR